MTPTTDETRKRTPSDYVFGKVLGDGSFSTVFLARDIHTNKEYAIKVLEKAHIIREKKTEYVMREKEVLRILGNSCPYFVKLYWTFQDAERLYFVLTCAKNGELLKQIDKHECFSPECARYYAAEIVLALEYLHGKGIIHRDLKPENILFDEKWHILITDFGSAKIVNAVNEKSDNVGHNKASKRRNSFVGTAQFVSPEMLKESASYYASDLWALGCIIYQMISGRMPFRGGSEHLIFQKILNLNYEYPEGFDSAAKDLVQKLLVLVPNKRLGATDEIPYSSIREHEFFNGLNWNDLGTPPKISDICDTINHIFPADAEPGLDTDKASRLLLDIITPLPSRTRKKSQAERKITDLSSTEIEQRLEIQKNNPFNGFVEGNLILKQGLIDKKKGLFPRRRMFLLTLGPHLYYVDPVTMTLKGEIPWSKDLRPEAKTFKIFFVHTPNRRYYLEDPEGYALEWCRVIDEVKNFYYKDQT